MRVCFVIALAIISSLALAPSAAAQAAPPPGPYNETCQNIQMKGSTLHAQCQAAGGKYVDAKLKDAQKCSDGVINLNGVLSCQTGLLPPGSYVTSCTDVRLQGTTLKASCKNSKDKSVNTELKSANQCSGDIANKDGALKCIAGPKAAKEATDKPEKKKKKKRFLVF
ncbi:MAG: CVNH domain-containing protein [Acidobacteriia bacterium]|nr:CVNH domain-containing protein [Terriglobia bacterium]